MATFTRNAWETGDTITAEGLNGAKGGGLFLELEAADTREFSIEIEKNIPIKEFLNLVVKCPDAYGMTLYKTVAFIDGTDEGENAGCQISLGEAGISGEIVNIYYFANTGVLTDVMPG